MFKGRLFKKTVSLLFYFLYYLLETEDVVPYRVGAVLWAMGTDSCDTVSLSSPCHSERRKYPCGMFSSRTLKNLKRILDFLKTKCSAFRESTGRLAAAEIPLTRPYGFDYGLRPPLRMTRRGKSTGIILYTAEIPPSLCYGAASQFDSLRSLRMTRREAS